MFPYYQGEIERGLDLLYDGKREKAKEYLLEFLQREEGAAYKAILGTLGETCSDEVDGLLKNVLSTAGYHLDDVRVQLQRMREFKF